MASCLSPGPSKSKAEKRENRRWAGRGWPRSRISALTNTLHAFMKNNIATGATAKTDGFASYAGVPHLSHEPHVIGPSAMPGAQKRSRAKRLKFAP
jgi:hypothetical protein